MQGSALHYAENCELCVCAALRKLYLNGVLACFLADYHLLRIAVVAPAAREISVKGGFLFAVNDNIILAALSVYLL